MTIVTLVSRYRERMSMPKIVISATGDEFFQPDDSYNWFNDMPGKTYVRLLPNSEHGMIPPQALSSPSIIHTISLGFTLLICGKMLLFVSENIFEISVTGLVRWPSLV